MTADVLGGVWTYAMELIAGLQAQAINVVLATFGGALQRHQCEAAARLDNLELHESRHPLEWMHNPWEDLDRAGEWLQQLEEGSQPALLHFNQFSLARLPWKSPKLVVAHSDVLTWWKQVRAEPAPADWNRYRDEVRAGLQAADLVVAPSQALLDDLQSTYGPLPRTRMIPNGRALAGTDLQPSKQPLILGVGRVWDEAKNLQLLDRIAPGLAWPVVLAGSAHHPNGGLVKLAHARALGEVSPAATIEWMRAASIYCLPAKYEPFGLSILEAALSRCALVLGAIPSLQENWTGAAVFVDPSNATALTTTLNELIHNGDARRALGDQAAERARAFSAGAMTNAYVETYGQLLLAS
jgi:glycosyltransferase involved in cell wall biosynthesis